MQSFHYQLRRILAGVVLFSTFAGAAVAQDLNAKLPVDPEVVTGKLPNGLTYYIRNNHKPEKKVELRLVVNAGSILEDTKQLGLAHFMEHMNFNGTKNFQKNDLVSYLQSIGVQFGADLNANTGFDVTQYILPIPTDKPGNLEKGFQIIEDWAHNALLTGKDIDEERGVVLEESRLGKGAQMRMLNKFFPKMASGSLYAERLPIGKDSILKTFKYDEIRRFYKDWYRPDLQAVIVVGDVDVNTAKKMLIEHFGGLKNPANEKARDYVDVKPRMQQDAMVVTDKEATNSIVMIMFPYTKKHAETTLGDYRNDIVKSLTLQIMNRRLGELAQSANPPFPFAALQFDNLIHGYESLNAVALFGPDGPQKSIDALTAEMMKAKQYGFTESELEIAKKEMLSGMEKAYNERTTTGSKDYVEEYIRNFSEGEAFPGIENEYSYYKTMLPGISASELNALFAGWMANTNTFTLVMAPDKSDVKLPNDAALLAMTANGFKQSIQQTAEKQVASSLMTKMPTPGKVVSQKKEEGLDATTYTLSNGVQVTIKPTTFKSDEILFKGIKKGGSDNYGLADRSNVHFATDMVEAMGVGDFSPSDLEKVLAGKTVEMNTAISDIDDDVEGKSGVKDFESMMQLAYLYMTAPRKDADLFAAYKQKQAMMLQFITSNPQASFADTVVKSLYGNNPMARMVFPKPSDFDKLDIDRSLEIYHNEFGIADGYHFFLTGNVDAATAIPLIEMYLGSLPAANKPATFKDNGVRPVAGVHTLKIHKGKENKSLIISIYHGDIAYSEDLSLRAKAVAEVLNIKVIEDLREKLGGIYTGGFGASVAQEPYQHYSMQLQLPCGPENVDKLLAAAKEEIVNLKAKGPDAKDLDKVKSQWREKYATDVKENKYWSDKMESILFWGRDKNHVLHYDAWIDKLTPAEIQETAKKLFDGKNEFTAILYPES